MPEPAKQYIAGIFLTERSFHYGVVPLRPDVVPLRRGPPIAELETPRKISVDDLNVREPAGIPKAALQECLKRILSVTGGGDLVSLVIGCFGPFVSLDPDAKGHEGYGQLTHINSHDGWENADLYSIARDYLKRRRLTCRINLHTEVDLAALGEFWYRYLDQSEERALGFIRHRHASFVDRSVHAFLKISRSVSGGIVMGGDIWRGRQHPTMSAMKPRRFSYRGIEDAYPGNCDVHGSCIEGMLGLRAVEERTGMPFRRIPADHPVWHLVAYYTATLCVNVTSIVAPSLITIGGRVIEEAPESARIIPRVRGHFFELIERDRRSPNYPEISRADGYIQGRGYSRSGLYGGLIMAERCHYHGED